jgi:prepilin-type N-terminal cleavage/methylation domain-containing protein
MKRNSLKQAPRAGFSLIELLLVLGIMAILGGLGAAGFKGVHAWLGAQQSRSLFAELQNACRLYRMERGTWPESFLDGEADLNAEGSGWRDQLGPYMESRVADRTIEDGDGNTRIFLIVDADGDHWIERDAFIAADPGQLPDRIWARVVVYSLDGEGALAATSWTDED